MMVAMNPQTFDQDVASIEPGGYLFYDSLAPLPPSRLRDDIVALGMPLTEICTREYTDPRQRQLFKNIVYVGALAALLDIDIGVVETLIGEQFKGKAKLIEPNLRRAAHRLRGRRDPVSPARSASAFGAATRSATASWSKAISPPRSARSMAARRSARGIRSRPRPRSPRRSSELRAPPGRSRRPAKKRYAIVQAEDEIAAIGMVDRRRLERRARFHRDLRPRHLADAGIPRPRLFRRNPGRRVRRAARRASTGMPTRTQQSDSLACAFASHGDTKHVLLFPDGPGEVLRIRRARLRSRRAAADADLRHARPRHRHEFASLRALRMGRYRAIRPRQGDVRPRIWKRARIRPLPRCRRRRHSLSDDVPAASDARRLFHPRHQPRSLCPLH